MELGHATVGLVPYLRIPLLGLAALVGVLGLVQRPAGAADVYSTGAVEARVRSSLHLRAHERAPIDIEVRNTSGIPCDLLVTLSPEYVDSFRDVAMIPEPTDRWSVLLENVAPGEERLVALELEAGTPGPRHGEVRIRSGRGEDLTIPLRTFVAP